MGNSTGAPSGDRWGGGGWGGSPSIRGDEWGPYPPYGPGGSGGPRGPRGGGCIPVPMPHPPPTGNPVPMPGPRGRPPPRDFPDSWKDRLPKTFPGKPNFPRYY